jgi:hypothetical protein
MEVTVEFIQMNPPRILETNYGDETVGGLENKILTLEDAIKSLKEESSMEKEGKTYSMDMRFHVYDLLVNNVPTKNIPILSTFFLLFPC